jgi:S1-C subfamily serine protease
MTSLGASGTTAGALMPPLDLVVMPLLKKSGQLGAGGDLIVAIDDRRIESEADLETELDTLKPGDTIYFTIVRPRPDGSHETLKKPVRLDDTNRPTLNAAARDSAHGNSPGSIAPLSPGR